MTHTKKRIVWIDNARAFGIMAVFFGHIIEQIFLSYSPKAHLQFKLVYSFHIPLFFILSGFFAKQHDLRFLSYLKGKFQSRIVPVIFFSALSLPIYVLSVKNSNIKYLAVQASYLFLGIPRFNYVIWFLVCLFTVEIMNYFIFPLVHKSRTRTVLGILIFYVIGWLISWRALSAVQVLQVSKIWCIQQAIMAYSFYLFGNLIYKSGLASNKMNAYTNSIVAAVSAFILLFTFNLNNGPFYQTTQQVVIMASAIYGNPFLFPLTAIAGSAFIITFSRLVPENRILLFLGKNSLLFMGLNGILFFLNRNFVVLGSTYISDKTIPMFILSIVLTLVSIAVCIPVALFLNKFLPQLTGAPRMKSLIETT